MIMVMKECDFMLQCCNHFNNGNDIEFDDNYFHEIKFNQKKLNMEHYTSLLCFFIILRRMKLFATTKEMKTSNLLRRNILIFFRSSVYTETYLQCLKTHVWKYTLVDYFSMLSSRIHFS